MNTSDQHTWNYIEQIAKARGTVLNHVIMVERLIDEVLSNYFCESNAYKKSRLFELLSEETNFNTKRINLERVIKSSHPDKYNKDVFIDLRELMEERNVFAHWIYDTSDSSNGVMKEGKIRLFRFRASKSKAENYKTYSNDDINTILRRADRCVLYLTALNLMGDLSSPDSSGPVT